MGSYSGGKMKAPLREFYYLTPKQFREKVRNCLRTCVRFKYKVLIEDFYANSLGMENSELYKGVIKSFKLIRTSPEMNSYKLKIEFTSGEQQEFDFSNYEVRIQDIRKKGNIFQLAWTLSGPYCYLTIKHI